MTSRILVILATVAACGCASAPPEVQIIDDAAAALGGRDTVRAVKTIVIEGEGTNGNLGQDMTPDASGQVFKLSDYKRAIDVPGVRVRVEQTRTPNFNFFQGRPPQKQVFGIDGDVAYVVAPNGTATRASNAVARDRRAEFYHHPVTAVRAAYDPSASRSNARTADNQSLIDITTADGVTLTLAVDNATKLPSRVSTVAYNANLGDVVIETTFADYQEVGGLQLPSNVTTKTDTVTTATIHATKMAVDADPGDLAAPEAARAAAAIAGPPVPNVVVQDVAKGVWLLGGQSHHSVLAELSDHLVLIEAPQSEARTLAVIAKAREVAPGKPLTHVINTHHHFDHSAGIRAAVAEGLTVVTQKANAAFFENAAGRRHAIAPDALAKNPKPIKVETVDDELVLKDKAMTINLYRVVGSGHGDSMLMAYFPNERIIVEADLYTPGGATSPYAANFLENIQKRGLKVDRIVPIHGPIGPYDELVKAAGALTH